jgi:hypothetical protein
MTSLVNVAIGNKVSIGCYATGAQPIRYNWTKDGFTINNSAVKIMENILVVQPRTIKDYGIYVCIVSNCMENATYSIDLQPFKNVCNENTETNTSQQGE